MSLSAANSSTITPSVFRMLLNFAFAAIVSIGSANASKPCISAHRPVFDQEFSQVLTPSQLAISAIPAEVAFAMTLGVNTDLRTDRGPGFESRRSSLEDS